jgi:hypothetical protein
MASKIVTMDIGSGRTISFNVREEVVAFFGIDVAPATAIEPRRRERKPFEYNRKKLGDDGAGTLVRVERSIWYDVGSSGSKPGSGKAITVPAGVKTAKGNERKVIIRVPAVAINLAISQWIFTKFKTAARRPGYFITPSGVRIPVINVTGVPDINPGEADADTTPTTA